MLIIDCPIQVAKLLLDVVRPGDLGDFTGRSLQSPNGAVGVTDFDLAINFVR